MGLAYVDSNKSDAGGMLSGSYPQLNKNNIVLDNRLTADKFARKHICGHFCGMEDNNT